MEQQFNKRAASDMLNAMTEYVKQHPYLIGGILGGGGLGALGGAFLTGDEDPDESTSSRILRRVKNALIGGALGAGSAAALGYGGNALFGGGSAVGAGTSGNGGAKGGKTPEEGADENGTSLLWAGTGAAGGGLGTYLGHKADKHFDKNVIRNGLTDTGAIKNKGAADKVTATNVRSSVKQLLDNGETKGEVGKSIAKSIGAENLDPNNMEAGRRSLLTKGNESSLRQLARAAGNDISALYDPKALGVDKLEAWNANNHWKPTNWLHDQVLNLRTRGAASKVKKLDDVLTGRAMQMSENLKATEAAGVTRDQVVEKLRENAALRAQQNADRAARANLLKQHQALLSPKTLTPEEANIAKMVARNARGTALRRTGLKGGGGLFGVLLGAGIPTAINAYNRSHN